MHEEFDRRLQSGSADFAASVLPPAPDLIRDRGNQRRRRRRAVMSATIAIAIAGGGAGTAYTSVDQSAAVPATTRPATALPYESPLRPGIVAVTGKGALVVLSPVTGEATRILVSSGVVGDAISVSPGGRTVYFAVRNGCADEIDAVPVTGGHPTVITTGVLPAVSPDGTKLAFVREPFGGGPTPSQYLKGCDAHVTGADFKVVIRDLSSGSETAYPAPPGVTTAMPFPVSRVSWAPDGTRLLVSVGPAQDNEGWQLAVMDPATSRYYLPSSAGVPLTGPDAAKSYYREGVFLPDGTMFVNRVCCAGWPVHTTSSLLWEIDASGHLIRQVAIGFSDRDHTSLDADPTGRWLLYLSGRDLFLSQDGSAPSILTSGLIAAAWL